MESNAQTSNLVGGASTGLAQQVSREAGAGVWSVTDPECPLPQGQQVIPWGKRPRLLPPTQLEDPSPTPQWQD
eukprot:5313351-Amphidinium_carterae.1